MSTNETNDLCSLPWVQLQFNTTGAIKTCCMQSDSYSADPTLSLKAVFNNEKLKQVRQDFLVGRVPADCKSCVELSRVTATQKTTMSPRWLEKYGQSLFENTSSDGHVRLPIRHLDLRFSSLCNFTCRTCDSASSSQWEDLDRQLGRPAISLKRWEQDPQVMKNIFSILPEVEEIYFAGGEPLINRGHYEVLDWLIEHKRTDVSLYYNTNLSLLRFGARDVTQYWSQFKTVLVNPSIDSMAEPGEYIRTGLNWQKFVENFLQIRSQVLGFQTLVSAFNILSVLDLVLWAKQEHGVHCNLFSCFSPSYLSVTIFPEELKKRFSERYYAFIERHRHVLDQMDIDRLRRVVQYMNSCDQSHLSEEFKKFTLFLDKKQNTSFAKTFPELADWYAAIPPR